MAGLSDNYALKSEREVKKRKKDNWQEMKLEAGLLLHLKYPTQIKYKMY